MSESPAGSLKPDENLIAENEKLRSEVAATKKQLEAKDKEICDLEAEVSEQFAELKTQDPEIERLNSELARRSADSEHLAFALEIPKVEEADLLNQLKGRHKKSKATLDDVKVILEILEERSKRLPPGFHIGFRGFPVSASEASESFREQIGKEGEQ